MDGNSNHIRTDELISFLLGIHSINRLKTDEIIKVCADRAYRDMCRTLKFNKQATKKGDFKKDVFDYEITIDDKDEILKIEPLLEDENATYDIIGNNNLKDGSIVSVVVTDSFGESKRSYNIKIHKKELKYVNKYSIVFMIIIGILVLINIIRIVSKNKRKVNGW